MKSLTIAYLTARPDPKIEWFLDSLANQLTGGVSVEVIVVAHSIVKTHVDSAIKNIRWSYCKPNVWQGKCKLTQDEWWAKSAYINTAVCLCKTDWIAFVDDRSVLMPTWLHAVRRAMDGNYAVAGAYQKRTGLTVENGYIKHSGIVVGEDPRQTLSTRPRTAPGSHWFGCTNALPLEWMLQINGADENCDSLGMEDVIQGMMLEANGYPIKYDPEMLMIEDRTPEFYESAVKRTDKGVSPNDKSHALLALTSGKKQATHHWNLREVREKVLRGEPFPIPDKPTRDWWDDKPLTEFP